MQRIMAFGGLGDTDVLEAGMLTKVVENAQKKVEGNNFGMRKHLLQYDQVMNEQREIIYGERNKVIAGADLSESVMKMVRAVISRAVDTGMSGEVPEDWDINAVNQTLAPIFRGPALDTTVRELDDKTREEVTDELYTRAEEIYKRREAEMTPERTREVERAVMMRAIDRHWMDHIDEMDQARQSVSMRGIAQRDPLIEYKFLGYELFDAMSNGIQRDTVYGMYSVAIAEEQQPQLQQAVRKEDMSTNSSETAQAKKTVRRAEAKPGRNDPCPCGSGRKFKQCCMNRG
jgi:preprotein translocase subunit SecA